MKKKILSQEINYYVLIVALMTFIAFFSYFVGPLLLIGNKFASIITTGTMGFILGWFISTFVKELDDITHHHHAAILLVVIFGAAINFLSSYAYIISTTNIVTNFNSIVIPLVFTIGFIAPYLIVSYNLK